MGFDPTLEGWKFGNSHIAKHMSEHIALLEIASLILQDKHPPSKNQGINCRRDSMKE